MPHNVRHMQNKYFAQLAGLSILWGATFLFTRVATPEIGPSLTAAGRIGLGAATLALIMTFTRHRWPWQHWRALAVLAALGEDTLVAGLGDARGRHLHALARADRLLIAANVHRHGAHLRLLQVDDVAPHQVLQESMRLYPPAWAISRKAIEADTIDDYYIPQGAMIVLSPYTMHRHPRYWTNPEGFDPERFRPEAAKDRPHFAYFPFGGGPRLCIGADFAMTEAQLVLTAVTQRYRLNLVPGHPVKPSPLITLRPKEGLQMTLHQRSAN